MNIDGVGVRRLTDGPSDDCPAWSPDGSKILYEGKESEGRQTFPVPNRAVGKLSAAERAPAPKWRLYSVRPDGSGRKPLTKGQWDERWPQWSPDGSKIAFTSYENGNGDIGLMRADGTSPQLLTRSPAEDMQPCWSRDGRQILFHSNRAGRFDVFRIASDGTDEHRLTVAPLDTREVLVSRRFRQARVLPTFPPRHGGRHENAVCRVIKALPAGSGGRWQPGIEADTRQAKGSRTSCKRQVRRDYKTLRGQGCCADCF